VYDSDAVLVESISACARAEAATAARRLAAIAELASRRCGTELADSRERWACDAWDSCAAEVAAELTISHRAASGLMHQGLDLRDRFPAVGALLAQGAIPVGVATTVTWREALREEAHRRHRYPHQPA
jgi:urease accessory protein UreF